MSPSAAEALKILRDGSLFQWYLIPLFAFVIYVYAVEVERRNWSIVLAGLAFWGVDWFNEMWNGLIFHFTGYAPAWAAPGKTAFLILIGLNIEICFMFAIAGVTFTKMLPADKHLKILGVPNRLFIGIVNSIFCVCVEMVLNHVNALTWDWSWWGRTAPWLIFLFGYWPFFLVSFWIFDMESMKKKVSIVAGIYVFDIICLVLFMGVLKWI